MDARRLVVEGTAVASLFFNIALFELSERLDERREVELADADLECDGDLVDANVTYSLIGSRLDLYKSELG